MNRNIFFSILLFILTIKYNIIISVNSNILSKIVIENKSELSHMFINSVDLYNHRIFYINNLFNKIVHYSGKYKAIVVLLKYKQIKPFINRNFLFLNKKYHDKLIFFVTEYTTKEEEKYRNISFYIIDISNIFFRFPYKFNYSAYTPNFIKGGKWNYQHMCRFFFRDIFLHPSLFDVNIFMRLDSESLLNTTINLFKYMKKNIVYMHNKIMNDAAFVVKELKNFTQSIVSSLKLKIKDIDNYNKTFKKTVLLYYNNFEICRVKFFRSKEMLKFTSIVDLSYGQFIYRWGDAPLRYISLSLFAENYTKLRLPNGIKYCHQGC